MSIATTTRLLPSAIGEPLVALLLRQVLKLGACNRITCECNKVNPSCTGRRTLQEALNGSFASENWKTAFETKLKPLDCEDGKIGFDGAHRVDCLLFSERAGVPLEVKLGKKGLGAKQVTSWFEKRCHRRKDKNDSYWITGKMMAVLDRRWQHFVPSSPLIALPERGTEVTLSEEWWLVVLKSTLCKWSKKAPTFSRSTHIVTLEQIAKEAGGEVFFDKVVVELVGSGFCNTWLTSIANG